MSWFSRTEDYSIEDDGRGFYGEPEITYGPTTDEEPGGSDTTSSTSGAWDDYQREYISSCYNEHTR